ncbi:hypothetical protein BGW36DRAFT_179583 [Talaromyces proteolyticus]|uniref:Uncharacterized protein n=1 Tax=Talaromyces proteolyticus TaxID=1131652 RepID=A0AAD4PZK1_9EURO|nr:uncharacterized protein BGW36DRAFT_179583 [Talaromyces proteolyticus]KAH8695978.1 hypothetical protein BGW36DRAFT_179583 [Talaromyces proteolyticus]
MSKSPFQYAEDPVPSYEESVRSTPTRSPLPQQTLPQQLDDARLSRVRNILSTYVDPLLAAQGASGIYNAVFLLIPSNVDSLQQQQSSSEYSYSTPKEPEVVGFASTDVVKLIRLKGEEHTIEFWRQPAVIEELGKGLRMRLEMSGHRVEKNESPEPVPEPAPSKPTSPPPSEKKASGWFRSKPKKQSKSWLNSTIPSEATITDHKLGWREKHEDVDLSKPLRRGLVRVRVEWKEVCLRVENELGLFETRKGPGVCLLVDVGS